MATLAPMSVDELRDLLAHLIAGAACGREADWRKRVAIERVPTWRFVRFNWTVEPSGTVEQRAVIAKAVEIVRGEHPYVV